jgi:hypothetical protein
VGRHYLRTCRLALGNSLAELLAVAISGLIRWLPQRVEVLGTEPLRR